MMATKPKPASKVRIIVHTLIRGQRSSRVLVISEKR